MSKILFEIQNGVVTSKVEGIKGPSCKELLARFTDGLGPEEDSGPTEERDQVADGGQLVQEQ